MLTQREYDEIELATLTRRLADLQIPGLRARQASPDRPYQQSIEADIARLRARLSSEEE